MEWRRAVSGPSEINDKRKRKAHLEKESDAMLSFRREYNQRDQTQRQRVVLRAVLKKEKQIG